MNDAQVGSLLSEAIAYINDARRLLALQEYSGYLSDIKAAQRLLRTVTENPRS